MIEFLDAATRFPTAIFTALLCVVIFYWLLALVGLFDLDAGSLDGGIDDIGVVASYLVAFGLNGVPFSIVVSLIILISWTLSCLAGMWVLPLLPTATLGALAGIGTLIVSFALSLPVTAWLLRPLRGLFVTHSARSNAALVGEHCKVLSQTVDAHFGRAEVHTRGASLNIKVWAEQPNTLHRGATARIVDYDPAGERYQIVEDASH
ncbi:hypothetical protein O4G98_15045 [Zoogloeaceae bacterium G21618-S1]|uniref:Ubiquinone biosynthesis protein n=1 Tax=Denitromonas halophila TaxID=1629404 RepID=A0A557QFE5_9RHOO|nr:ubiquinone biosynthesis protein [Denitromonas halophila]MCZ4306049.1 hypothetical protein [Zoogloeaceae bacterium G21618-S1]TVO51626.1 ubiquinone biosynthesis protein [Denitromonas halophila]